MYKEYAQHIGADEFVLKWVDTTLTKYLEKNAPPTEEVEHILDYLVQSGKKVERMSYEQAHTLAEKWNKLLQKKGANIEEKPEDTELLYDFGDGFKIVKLVATNASSGHYAKNASSGRSAKNASSGDSATNASSGHYATNASSGHYATNASSGRSAKNASSGDSATNASSGHYATNASSGHYATNASSGHYAKNASSGRSAKNASSGDSATNASSGDYATNASSGHYAKNEMFGHYSVSVDAGNNGMAKGKIGCWFCLSEWAEDEKDNIWKPVCVKAVKIDGKKIKEDTWYKLEKGEFVEVK